MLRYIQPDWSHLQGIHVYSSTRLYGVSKAPWDSLNLGSHVQDCEAAVLANRKRLAQSLQWPGDPRWLNQVHGSDVYQVSANSKVASTVTADAVMTTEAGQVLSILTADCLPVVFVAPNAHAVAVAHAGWRSLVAGVLQNVLATVPADPVDIHVWLGPAIGPGAFEIGSEVRQQFLAALPGCEAAFVAKAASAEPGKWFADLYDLARIILDRAGVKQISGGQHCTFSEHELFFSHRRDGPATGRMGTFVWMDAW